MLQTLGTQIALIKLSESQKQNNRQKFERETAGRGGWGGIEMGVDRSESGQCALYTYVKIKWKVTEKNTHC